MRAILSVYRFLNLVSLDIVAGAVLSALFFANLLGVAILPYALIALGLAVWIIYTVDHLRDAARIGEGASSARHRFHYKYAKPLRVMVVLCAACVGWLLLFMRENILLGGLVLAGFVAAYLLAQRYLKWTKELSVAVMYTCGVLLPSVTVHKEPLSIIDYGTFCAFSVVALVNLLVLSWYDYESDRRDQQRSFATVLGKAFTGKMIYGLSFMNLAGLMFMLPYSVHRLALLTIVVMNAILLMVFGIPGAMQPHDRYRLIGDAVFLLPGLHWLWTS